MKKVGVTLTAGLGALVLFNLWMALIWSPPEAKMGNLVRIMYFHVASAWIAFLAFFVTFVFSILYLWRKQEVSDRISAASAEIGIVYTSVTLVTGSLWARPIWNTWWTWDPRLTTTLILWFLYVAYLLLRETISSYQARARVSAIYAIIAFADVPIIHMSVTWWRSIHPNVITESGFNMPGSMVLTLMIGFATFLCIYICVLWLRVKQHGFQSQLLELREQLHRVRAQQGGLR